MLARNGFLVLHSSRMSQLITKHYSLPGLQRLFHNRLVLPVALSAGITNACPAALQFPIRRCAGLMTQVRTFGCSLHRSCGKDKCEQKGGGEGPFS